MTGGVACSGDEVTAGGGRGSCRSLARKARVQVESRMSHPPVLGRAELSGYGQ